MFVEGHRETLHRLRDVARRRAVLATLVFTVVASVAAAVALALPSLYRATAVLAVDPGRSDPEPPAELSARLDTISQRVLSRTPLLDQARRFGLYPELAAQGLWDAVVERMKSDIRLEPKVTADAGGRGALVGVSLSYRGRDPVTAARVSNSLADLFLEQDASLRSQRHSGHVELLKQKLDEMKERLEQDAERADARRSPPAGAGAAVDVGALDRLGSQLRALREERTRALERREGLRKQLAEADPGNAVSARLDALRQELVQRRRKFTDRHPDVLQLQGEIEALEQEPRELTGAPLPEGAKGPVQEALDETEEALRSMKRDEDALSLELAAVQEGRRAAPARTPSAPPRDFPAVQEVYGSLLRRYQDAQLADSAEEALASRLRLLDTAVPPLREAGPPRARLMLIGVLGGLAAGLAGAALAERLDRSFRHLDDLRAFTRVPVVATVPALVTGPDRWRQRLRLACTLAGVAVGITCLGLGSYHAFARGYWLTAALERTR